LNTIDVTLPGARVMFTTRDGGVSEGPYSSLNLGILTDDDQSNVAENRRRLVAAAEVGTVGMGFQVHGTDVLEWDGPHEYASPPRVDGHTTTAADIGLLVLAADCLPVALASESRVAMLHCGWRGLAGGIVERALEEFDWGGPVAAAIGPGIGRCHYEVGAEVLEVFSAYEGVASGRMLDLKAVAAAKLRAAGVVDVVDVDRCTFCDPDAFFSHRRDEGVTGRQGGMVWRA
jgi:polyphenol oxidase